MCEGLSRGEIKEVVQRHLDATSLANPPRIYRRFVLSAPLASSQKTLQDSTFDEILQGLDITVEVCVADCEPLPDWVLAMQSK